MTGVISLNLINNGIRMTRFVTRWIATIAIFVMMLVITISVLMRSFGSPLSGQVELVELLMLTLIMVGLSYTQSENGHVDVGLLVDRLPTKVQAVFDILGSLLIIAVSLTISYYNFQGFFNYLNVGFTSQILSIPLSPFKLIVAIGLLLWALEGLLKMAKAIVILRNGKQPVE